MATTRPSKRQNDELRRISIERAVSMHAEGSCLIKFGNTHVLCMASVEERIPPWLKGQGRGWVTAEYAMLPRATKERTRREVTNGQPSGRTQEIQRLIGRALRAVVDLKALGERQIPSTATSSKPTAAPEPPPLPAPGLPCTIACNG